MTPQHSVVWFEIPVTDLKRAAAFYENILATKLKRDETGPNPIHLFPVTDERTGISGHIYPGKPSPAGTGNTVHLLAPDAKLEDTLARVEPAGGKVVSPVIQIPLGRFAYCTDPDGNSIGLFVYTAR
jgi:predicted enzyme related to lactoylglutathione lyase